jgi:hypothetical protein
MHNLQISIFVLNQQAEALAKILMDNGSMRLYAGIQPLITTRTDGRLSENKITSATVNDGALTVKWTESRVFKSGTVSYYRLCTGNIPVMAGSVGVETKNSDGSFTSNFDMSIAETDIKIGMVIPSGTLIHYMFSNK